MAAANEVTGIVGQSRATYAAMLKLWYARRWDDHVHTANFIMKLLGKRGATMGGERVKAVVVTGFPQSAGITSREGKPLPTARTGTQINPELFARDFYTLLSWTGQAERSAAAGDKASWAKPRKLDMELARLQGDINLCRKIYLGYGDVLGVVVSAATTGGVTVLTMQPRNSRTSSGAAFWYFGRHYCRVNQSVGIIRSAAGALGSPSHAGNVAWDQEAIANEVYITAMGGTNAAPTVTLSADTTGAPWNLSLANTAAAYLTPFNNRSNTNETGATGTYGAASDVITLFSGFNGVATINTDDSIYAALYGLAKSTNPSLKGVYDTNGGVVRPYEEKLLHLNVDKIRDDGTGMEPKVAVLHSSTRREVVAEHDGDRRYAPVQTESGYGQLVAHVGDTQMPYRSDWLAPPACVMTFTPDDWEWVEQSPMGPIDDSLERWVAGYDRHEIIWHKSGNIESETPFNNGMVDDVDVDVYAINT